MISHYSTENDCTHYCGYFLQSFPRWPLIYSCPTTEHTQGQQLYLVTANWTSMHFEGTPDSVCDVRCINMFLLTLPASPASKTDEIKSWGLTGAYINMVAVVQHWFRTDWQKRLPLPGEMLEDPEASLTSSLYAAVQFWANFHPIWQNRNLALTRGIFLRRSFLSQAIHERILPNPNITSMSGIWIFPFCPT